MNKQYPLLDSIAHPVDIHAFTLDELHQICDEIRQRIIEVMAVNGGHLASSLGAVELTVALHHTFHAPKDKFVFDVGHQSYPHKLLTGRHKDFFKVRQYRGLCGFTHPQESPYDHFHAGHAGTAVSLALGMATSRDMRQDPGYVLPIIGDASLTCGLTLEALNNISRNLQRFIIVLNDNAMSISQNVGAITNILSRLLNSPRANKIRREVENLVAKIPSYGTALAKGGHKLTEGLKNLVSPAPFFDEFGLSYIGPIDGHDLGQLLDVACAVKDLQGPVILHVMTVKGKGMPEAMKNPVSYHGVKPFDIETGKFLPLATKKPTYPKVFGQVILQMAASDPSIVVATPAMTAGSCLDAFKTQFPSRCHDVGIAEGHCVTYCGGLAYDRSLKVVCSIYSTFLQRALDNLFHDVCLQEVPVVFAIDRAGISGPDGSTHHGIYDIAFLNSMPGMVIAQPRNGQVLAEILHSAFEWKRPCAIRYPNMETEGPCSLVKKRALGQGEILQEGKDVLLLSLGHMHQTALQVWQILQKANIHATLMDPVFLKPLDTSLLQSLLAHHSLIVTIEEHCLSGGLGAIINNWLMNQQRADVHRMSFGIPDRFVGHGQYKSLIEELGLTAEKIAPQILQKLSSIGCGSLTHA